MKKRDVVGCLKNAIGAVFLLAGAFFVCSTLLSMRTVLADPIAPMNTVNNPLLMRASQSPRNAVNTRSVTARTTTSAATRTNAGRAVGTRGATSNTTTRNGETRVVRSRANNNGNAQRETTNRNVIARTSTARARNVVARTGVAPNVSRVSLVGTAMRGSSGTTTTNTYLSSKLYTGNYSNIIDSTTGLISADAYSNCMESYYTCMDEICTARSASKRRCSCAARVKNFINAEEQLETANEELIKVSGELALLVATNGKDVSSAFQLTDAEKVMNCVSWKEVTNQYGTNSDEAKDWCYNHGIYGNNGASLSSCNQPSYCASTGNSFGFDIGNIEGSSSDILASLKSWADAKDNAMGYTKNDNENLFSQYSNMSSLVNDLSGLNITSNTTENTTLDELANTWGYDLFEYAHNNVCSRVLDSCFNGIYEACGTPPSGGKCANGASSSCPFNYNSKVDVSSAGDVVLNERGSTNATNSSSATCFGYTSTSGDPYTSLRGPVADARRSIMQKYLLDSNADCDAYGEELKATAQNIAYQKEAAKQALQQKRLEFYTQEQDKIVADAREAITNFNECISELWDCYDEMSDEEEHWTSARIKTYCAQVAQVPHCYETMMVNPVDVKYLAVIDKPDSASCVYDADDYTKNTCRNIVTLNEILNGVDGASLSGNALPDSRNSKSLREYYLRRALGCSDGNNNTCIRGWSKAWDASNPDDSYAGTTVTCQPGYYLPSNQDRCQICSAGFYCEGTVCVTNSSVDCGMTRCPIGKTSVAGAKSNTECKM